jgi:hypothetical protein
MKGYVGGDGCLKLVGSEFSIQAELFPWLRGRRPWPAGRQSGRFRLNDEARLEEIA